ncbi:hypothetical protein F511_16686 [Dorcoceras hygrometricum]|uniref:Uncharacterized protein n=1 Tax=Dorcoceras hygrometricum TaxID=472368 RepID=A0A2Z7CW59_9LAMI|nr:hypothetical protein F511_16686 [Dorcoceras hygrometricum]
MGKAELVKAMQEAVMATPKKTTKKRKAPSEAEKEARGEKRKKAGASTSGVRTEEASQRKLAPTPPTSVSEEALDVPPVTATVGGPSSGKGLEQPPPFDPSKDSLIESPCPVAATRYICNMAPDRDVRVLRKAHNADVVGHFSSHAAAVVAWGGEMVKRLTKAHQKMNASRDQFDKAMGQHAEVLARLEELETLRSREKEAEKTQREALEAQLLVEREAHEAEKAAREMLEAELEEKSYMSFPVRNWAYVLSWSGLCVCIEELREFASAELSLCAELVGLMCLRRRAMRVCQWGTGLMCRVGRAYVLSSGRHPRSSILDTMS